MLGAATAAVLLSLVVLSGPARAAVSRTNDDPAPEVTGGQDAAIADYPFMAAIRRGGGPWCGGTVIGPREVLTAAHCVLDPQGRAYSIEVVVGSSRPGRSGRHLGVVRSLVATGFTHDPLVHDLAVVRLDGDTRVPAVAVVGWSDAAATQAGTWRRVLGWGNTSAGSGPSPRLLRADVQLAADPDCARRIQGFESSTQFCTVPPSRWCPGDSGGPVLVNRFGQWVQVGVMSGMTGDCGGRNSTNVATELGALVPLECVTSDRWGTLGSVKRALECLVGLYGQSRRAMAVDRYGEVGRRLFDEIHPAGAFRRVDCYSNDICALRWTGGCATAYFFLSADVPPRRQVYDITIGCSSGTD